MKRSRSTDELVHQAREGTRPCTADVLWSLPRVGAPVPSPDGSSAVVPVTTYDVATNISMTRLWLVDVGGKAPPRALTSPDRSASDPCFSPDGRRLAFVSRLVPKEREEADPAQLHVMPLDGGESECLTDLPLGAFDPQWLPSGEGIVVGAWLFRDQPSLEGTRKEKERRKEEPGRPFITEDRFIRYWDTWLVQGRIPHLFLVDPSGEGLRDLMPEETLLFDMMDPSGQYDISPDGRSLVMTATIRGEGDRPRDDVFLLDLDGGRPRCLTADNPADSRGARFAPDGSIVYGRTETPDFYADRVRLYRTDDSGREHTPVLTAWAVSPGSWRFAADGGLLLVGEVNARVGVFRLPAGAPDSGDAVETLMLRGTAGGVRPVGSGAVLLHHDLSSPPEVHRLDADGSFTRLTRFTEGVWKDVALGEVREMHFAGAEGAQVQMLVVRPPGAGTKALPLVHMIHGGPHGMFGDGWFWRWHAHAFAARGQVAALVNFHGSTSWGQAFAESIQGAWGDRPMQDILCATDVLVAEGIADPDRMAISGGSYGGYLTSWIASNTSRFKCAVNHAGVYDLQLQMASDYNWGWKRAIGGTTWEDIEALDRYSPARAAAGLETPMLVVHGEKDYRVPVDQALLCYNVLKARGVPARLVYFPDENHWVLKPTNSLIWYEEVLDWFDRFLRPDAADENVSA